MRTPTIAYLSNIYFEVGAVEGLPELLDDLGVSRPLVVTDQGVVGAGLTSRLRLKGAGHIR